MDQRTSSGKGVCSLARHEQHALNPNLTHRWVYCFYCAASPPHDKAYVFAGRHDRFAPVFTWHLKTNDGVFFYRFFADSNNSSSRGSNRNSDLTQLTISLPSLPSCPSFCVVRVSCVRLCACYPRRHGNVRTCSKLEAGDADVKVEFRGGANERFGQGLEKEMKFGDFLSELEAKSDLYYLTTQVGGGGTQTATALLEEKAGRNGGGYKEST